MGNKSRYKSSSIFDMQFITSSISTTLVLLLLGLVVFHPVCERRACCWCRPGYQGPVKEDHVL